MTRKKKPDPWSEEVEWATAICAPLSCVVARSTHQYEIATVKGDGVQLVIYPHHTRALNYHARVRDNGSKDKAAADKVMAALDCGEGLPEELSNRIHYSCTFSRKWGGNPPAWLKDRGI